MLGRLPTQVSVSCDALGSYKGCTKHKQPGGGIVA